MTTSMPKEYLGVNLHRDKYFGCIFLLIEFSLSFFLWSTVSVLPMRYGSVQPPGTVASEKFFSTLLFFSPKALFIPDWCHSVDQWTLFSLGYHTCSLHYHVFITLSRLFSLRYHTCFHFSHTCFRYNITRVFISRTNVIIKSSHMISLRYNVCFHYVFTHVFVTLSHVFLYSLHMFSLRLNTFFHYVNTHVSVTLSHVSLYSLHVF